MPSNEKYEFNRKKIAQKKFPPIFFNKLVVV